MEQFEVEEPLNTKKEQKKGSNHKTLLIGLFCIFGLVCFYLALTQKSFINYTSNKSNDTKKYSVVIGDIGGTNVRLSLLRMSKDPNVPYEKLRKDKVSTKDYPSLEELFKKYLSKIRKEDYPLYAVIGIAGPIKNNEVYHLENIPHWPSANGDDFAKKFNIKKFLFLNDFTCNGYGIQAKLKLGEDYVVINDEPPQKGGSRVVMGPGTGLGMGYLVKDPNSEYFTIGGSEGGHQDFAPKTKQYFEMREFFINYLHTDGLSNERVLSGPGLIPMYKFFLSQNKNEKRDKELGDKIDKHTNSTNSKSANKLNMEIVQKGLNGKCALSKKVLETFVEIFGEVAGDVALFALPTDGLYLVGGMSIALESIIKGTNIFMDHFLNKDNFEYLLKTFPVYLVKNGDLGILGARECARRLIVKNE